MLWPEKIKGLDPISQLLSKQSANLAAIEVYPQLSLLVIAMRDDTYLYRRRHSWLTISLMIFMAWLGGCTSEVPPMVTWEHSSSGLFDAAVSNNGDFAVVSSFSDGTSLWDLQNNKRLYDWRHQDDGNDISLAVFSADDSHVLTVDGKTFVIWSVSNGTALGYWVAESDILDAALSDNAEHILLGLKDGRALHINRLNGRRLEVIAHRNEWVTTVAMSADGRLAATGGNDRRVMVWNAFNGDEVQVFDHPNRIVKVALSNDQSKVLSADEDANAFVWSVETGSRISRLKLKRNELHVEEARFSRDGQRLLVGFPGRNVSLWRTKTGERMQSWMTPARSHGWVPQGSTVYAVAFASNEKAIIAQSSNGLGGKWKLL